MGTPRRRFLETSALAGAAVSLGPLPLFAATRTAAGARPLPSWVDRPMRWAQLTLVEDEPAKLDVGFWLDYFRRTRSDGACLSAGGCVAYYPTEVPFHHRSAWLGERDVFGELVAGCRKLGMAVLARTDPHATYDDVQAAHPDWIAVDAEGRPRRHWASPEMWVTCGLGPYNFAFMTEVTREIVARYRPDGIFVNRWDGSGTCYCAHCRQGFRAASGLELPRGAEPLDPAQRAYRRWRQERLFELWRVWDDAIRALNPDACLIPNTGGGATSSLDMKRTGELAPMLVADRQARRGLMPPWAIGMNAKEYRAVMGPKPVGRPLQRRRRGALPLEGLGSGRRGDPALGRRPGRERHAALVHEVRGRAARPALAEAGRGGLRLVPRRRALPAQRAPARARRARLLAAERLDLRSRPRPRARRGAGARLVPGARRVARPVRDGARRPARRGAPRSVPDARAAERRGAVGRAVRAARRLRPPRRRAGRDLGDLAARRRRRGAPRLRARRPVRGVVRGPQAGPGAQRLPAARARLGRGPPAAARAGGRTADHPRRLAARRHAAAAVPEPAPDPHPVLPRPADGEGVRARGAARRRRRPSRARRDGVASSTSPGTSTARSGRCSRPTT